MRLPLCFAIPILLFVSSCTSATHQNAENYPTQNETPIVQTVLAADTPSDSNSEWQRIAGSPGFDEQYGSGYIDLASVHTFVQGEQLRLKIGGTAHKVVVRLLPAGGNPNKPVGVLDEYPVPKDRLLIVRLNSVHAETRQISVHGGPRPWDLYDLGGGNGPATLLSVDRKTP